jgi:hypothetical protein
VADLERLASEDVVFDRDKYEELLLVYRRFMAFMDVQASKQGKKKK